MECTVPNPRSPLLKMSHIADLAGVSMNTAQAWRKRGVFPEPDVHESRHPLWRKQTVVRWLERTGRTEPPKT